MTSIVSMYGYFLEVHVKLGSIKSQIDAGGNLLVVYISAGAMRHFFRNGQVTG